MERGFQEIFNWGFIGSFTAASTAVIAIANTLRQWWGLESRWSALVASEVLTFYAAANATLEWRWWTAFVAFGFGLLLCCYAVGLQASVVGIKHRVTGVAPTWEGWWAPWF